MIDRSKKVKDRKSLQNWVAEMAPKVEKCCWWDAGRCKIPANNYVGSRWFCPKHLAVRRNQLLSHNFWKQLAASTSRPCTVGSSGRSVEPRCRRDAAWRDEWNGFDYCEHHANLNLPEIYGI